MVDMRMCQDDGIDALRLKGEGAAIESLQGPAPLKKAAIDQEAFPSMAKFHAGASDRACRAMKGECEFLCHATLCVRFVARDPARQGTVVNRYIYLIFPSPESPRRSIERCLFRRIIVLSA
jgi:hypothetical protein